MGANGDAICYRHFRGPWRQRRSIAGHSARCLQWHESLHRRSVWHDLAEGYASGCVQGVGHVGYYLCELLHMEGAKLFITDIDQESLAIAAQKFGATIVKPEEIYGVDADIFAPCALGAILNEETIPQFKFKIVAGAANNQLKIEAENGPQLIDRGILYAPDYVINAGGLINVANEIEGYNRQRALSQADGIYDILKNVIKVSKEENIPTYVASNRIAERRIEQVGRLRRKFTNPARGSKHNGRFSIS